jgi:hypothetical protein
MSRPILIEKTIKNACIIDHWKLMNLHEIIMATNGGGKTVCLHVKTDREWVPGAPVFIVDKELEFNDHTKARGGEWSENAS